LVGIDLYRRVHLGDRTVEIAGGRKPHGADAVGLDQAIIVGRA
jgi:hypothetical protein